MEKENAIQILNSRKLLTKPGKFQVKVTNITPFERPGSGLLTNIVSYAAMTPFQLGEARRLFSEGDYQGATNQHLASSQRMGLDFTPTKGDLVNIVLDYIPTKGDPTVKALLVVNCSAIATETATNVNFMNEDDMNLLDSASARGENIDVSTDPTKTKRAKAATKEAEHVLVGGGIGDEAPQV